MEKENEELVLFKKYYFLEIMNKYNEHGNIEVILLFELNGRFKLILFFSNFNLLW